MRNTCQVAGCDEYQIGGGLCRKHYMRLQRKGSTDDVRKNARGPCSVAGCEEAHVAHGLCGNHYRQEHQRERRLAAKVADPRACVGCGVAIAPEKQRRGPTSFCSRACKDRHRVTAGLAARDARKSYFKTRYGLTVAQVDEMAAKGCAICGTTEWPGRHNRPHVDHDHTTGEVRGLLCSECNTGLGKFKDDPVILQAAISYLG
jgi:hypothetical protein